MSDLATVYDAWLKVQADIKAVGKDGRNQQQSYNFRGIDGVMNAVGPVLRKHGVTVTPTLAKRESSTVEVGKNRTLMRVVDVEVDYTVRGPMGDEFHGRTPGEAMDAGDKATSKAMSVAYRTFLIQALTLPTHDVDPDAETYTRSEAITPDPVDSSRITRERGDPLGALKAEVLAAAAPPKFATKGEFAAAFESVTGSTYAEADETALRNFLASLEVAA